MVHTLAYPVDVAAGGDPGGVLAHRLAAALLFWATGRTADLASTVAALARDLRRHPDTAPPAEPDTVAGVVEQVPGVRFAAVLAALVPGPATRTALLTEILNEARFAADPVAAHLAQWEPVIARIVAAASGDHHAAHDLEPTLDELAATADWAALVAVLRRITAGERGLDLLDSLDDMDTAIARAVLARLAAH
jgi:hypothetical protein